MCNGNSSSYESFAMARKGMSDLPVTRNLLVHEILNNLYKKNFTKKEVNFSGYTNVKISLPIDEDIRFVGTLDNLSSTISSLSDRIAVCFKNFPVIIDEKEFSEIGEKAARESDGYYMSLSDSGIILVFEVKEVEREGLIVTEDINFYLHIPKNVKIVLRS